MRNIKKNQKYLFQFTNPKVNLEVKYVYYQQLFNDKWTLTSSFYNSNELKKIDKIFKRKIPYLHSILDLDIEKAEREWLFWLDQQGFQNTTNSKNVVETVLVNHVLETFCETIYSKLFPLTDTREEWEKDRWDVRVLHDKYGMITTKVYTNYYIDFTKIEQGNMREQVKKYIKQRLLSKNNFSWGTATHYLKTYRFFIFRVFVRANME